MSPGDPLVCCSPTPKQSFEVKMTAPSRGGDRLDLPQNGRGKRIGVRVTGVGWPRESHAWEGEGLLMKS